MLMLMTGSERPMKVVSPHECSESNTSCGLDNVIWPDDCANNQKQVWKTSTKTKNKKTTTEQWMRSHQWVST